MSADPNAPVPPGADAEDLAAHDGGEDGDREVTAEQIELDLDALMAERDQFKDLALRTKADFENYRRRTGTQATEDIERATGRLVESLLPVLDACEAAFSHGADGVEPVWSALMGALQRQGLEALDLQDKPFDPEVAEAVAHEPGADDSLDGALDGPVVIDVLRTGYRWKGRVLRPAMVRTRG